jgi:hypothetical protein
VYREDGRRALFSLLGNDNINIPLECTVRFMISFSIKNHWDVAPITNSHQLGKGSSAITRS